MASTDLAPLITTHHYHLSAPLPSAPAFAFHLTRLASTLFVWVGTASSSGGLGIPAAGGLGADAGEQYSGMDRRLAAEWGVAMPSRGSLPTVATPVFRGGSSDVAVPMAQRLARKFPSNQIHLSLSLPSSLTAPSGPSLDPFASKTLLVLEKELSKWLADVLAKEQA